MIEGKTLLENGHHAPVIGHHRTALSQKFGAPRQPNLVALTSVIEMHSPYDTPAAFHGLEAFSHIWVSWQFHHNYRDKENTKADPHFRAQVRPPRLGGNQKIGVFASRSMYRPSGLGLSVVKLKHIEVLEGRVLLVIEGADMIDGTPIIDIKPYVAYSDALPYSESGFAKAAPSLLEVTISASAYAQFMTLVETDKLTTTKTGGSKDIRQCDTVSAMVAGVRSQLTTADIDIIKALIAQDPRPAYRRAETNVPFVMRYKSVDVGFQMVATDQLQITTVVAV